MLMPAEIADVLERGGEVVTANARSARALLQCYANDARARGIRSWKSPRVQAWGEWVDAQYAELPLDLPAVLSGLQELALWKRVQRDEAARVVSPHRLAKLAQDAYALLHGYAAAAAFTPARFPDLHVDAEHFLQWSAAFDRECTRLRVVSRTRCEGLLERHANELRMPGELLLVGFDRLSPAQANLLAALQRHEARCTHYQPDQGSLSARVVEAGDARQEMEACALWVRDRLAYDPAQRIGVLSANLGAMRAGIDRVFRRVLLPESAQRAVGGPLPYEFSLGVPLARMPNVAAALSLLHWLNQPLDAAEVSCLLLGDFLAADAEEARQLASADASLRRRGLLRAEMPLVTLLRGTGSVLPQTVRQRLGATHTGWQLQQRRMHRWPQWADLATEALQRAGWPGYREQSSTLYQAQEAWSRLLEEIAQLGALDDRVPWRTFLETAQASAQDRLFAAEAVNAPVQVVGLAEAAGQTFDAVWVLGMTEERWPGHGRMHPLLPPALQSSYGMPHAEREADHALAQTQLQRVAAGTPSVVWSYALAESGVEQRPAPMLQGLYPSCRAEAALLLAPPPPARLLHVREQLRVPPWPVQRVAGGSEVLKRQAACGFQSMAHARLGADRLEGETWGLDLRSRAVLLHRALEALWSVEPVPEGSHRLHSLDDLLDALANDRLQECVTAAVTHALHEARQQAQDDGWNTEFLLLEGRRLTRRILDWLDNEHERAPFRVAALEKKVDTAEIGELRLRLRLDRADTLEDGTTLLLDYKTSDAVSVKQWSGARPDEPQLPIYATFGAMFGGLPRVGAVAFAQVRAGKSCMHAVAEQPVQQLGTRFATPEGKPPRHLLTPAMRAEWDGALRSLAQQFLDGETPVNPKHGSQTCRQCGLHALCRVRSQRGGFVTADDEEADDA